MKEWKEYKISDVCSISSSKRIFANEYKLSGIPFYRGKEIIEKQKGSNVSNELFISEKRFLEIKNKFGSPMEGDMLLTSVGTLGVPYIVKQNEVFYFKDGNLTWFYDFKNINNRYLYYWFLSPVAKHYIDTKAIGSTQKALTIETLKGFNISLPSIDTQNKIVEILSSLDDKIELNRRINDNLEQQVQLMFDKTFVNYPATNFCRLSDIANINPKRIISKNTKARYIEMSNLPTKGSFPCKWEYKDYNGGMKFTNGDTIMARITPCLENGKVAYINFLDKGEISFGSTEYIVISSKGTYRPEWFYFLTRNKLFIDYSIKHMNGSSGRQRVSGESIGDFQIPLFSMDSLQPLFTMSEIALKTITRNSLENIKLSAIRDFVLPKLMSGELKINEINN